MGLWIEIIRKKISQTLSRGTKQRTVATSAAEKAVRPDVQPTGNKNYHGPLSVP